MRMTLTRNITVIECFWLKRTYWKGETVYRHHGATYGVITSVGVACTNRPGQLPFFELPGDALEECHENTTRVQANKERS
jgi:hypothetical protein